MPDTFRATYEGHTLRLEKSSVRKDVLVTLDHPDYSRRGYVRTNGPALRDALLEAFPLEEPTPSGAADRLADWEKELLGVDEPEFLDVVPGMVIVDRNWDGRYRRVTLPDGRYYNYEVGVFGDWIYRAPRAEEYKVVFDPRGAKALPNPLGIRVGDRVRKTKDGVTISFEVGHIGDGTGHIFAKGDSPNFPVAYNPKGFTVTSREVPDRLPAGTITREKERGSLVLRVEQGSIALTGDYPGYEAPEGVQEDDLRRGDYEVIYLPES